MKTIASFSLIFLLALSALPLSAKKPAKAEPSVGLVDQMSETDKARFADIIAERDSLQAEFNALQTKIAALDDYIRSGVNPMLECASDTLDIVMLNSEAYRDALSAYERVKPLTQYYNPYSQEDNLDSKASKVQKRLALADKVAEIKTQLSTGHYTKKKVEENILKIDKLMADKALTEADKVALEKLKTDLSRDYNWTEIFKGVVKELSTWAVLDSKKTASDAYKEIIKPKLVNKIAEVYPGRNFLPSQFVKLNKVLSELIDCTLNFSQGNNASKVRTEGAFKAWIKRLNDSL